MFYQRLRRFLLNALDWHANTQANNVYFAFDLTSENSRFENNSDKTLTYVMFRLCCGASVYSKSILGPGAFIPTPQKAEPHLSDKVRTFFYKVQKSAPVYLLLRPLEWNVLELATASARPKV